MFLILSLSFHLFGCSSLKEETENKAKETKAAAGAEIDTGKETEPETTEDPYAGETEIDFSQFETEPQKTEPKPTKPKPTEPEPTEIVLDPDNYFYNDENTFYEEDKIIVRPLHVYWTEDGKLYARCAIVNGYASAVKDIYITYLGFANSNGTIADGDFGLIEDVTLEPYHYIVWDFVFEGDAVQAFGANLHSLDYYNEYTASIIN